MRFFLCFFYDVKGYHRRISLSQTTTEWYMLAPLLDADVSSSEAGSLRVRVTTFKLH
jgi:hypothetical protein